MASGLFLRLRLDQLYVHNQGCIAGAQGRLDEWSQEMLNIGAGA